MSLELFRFLELFPFFFGCTILVAAGIVASMRFFQATNFFDATVIPILLGGMIGAVGKSFLGGFFDATCSTEALAHSLTNGLSVIGITVGFLLHLIVRYRGRSQNAP